jgi:hypothetical protein
MLDTITKENLEEVDTTTLESLTMIISKLSIINDNITKLRSELKEKPISGFDKELIRRLRK